MAPCGLPWRPGRWKHSHFHVGKVLENILNNGCVAKQRPTIKTIAFSAHYSVKAKSIVPMSLILFRKGGMLPPEGRDDHVYDRKASRGKMGTV